MATQASPSHLQTRQQLDELDALLQRMLALPSSPEMPVALAEPVEPEEFAPLPPTLPMTQRSAVYESNVQSWRMSAPVMEPPLATAVEDTPLHQPAPYPYSMVYGQPLPAETPPPLEPWTPPPPPRATEVPYAAPAWAAEATPANESYPSAMALPFIAVNRLFDLLTFLLGPFGGWLRRPNGRNTLGWLGILMIVAAVGWVALEWYGFDWTRQSFSLR